jgi:hypothetical protein
MVSAGYLNTFQKLKSREVNVAHENHYAPLSFVMQRSDIGETCGLILIVHRNLCAALADVGFGN